MIWIAGFVDLAISRCPERLDIVQQQQLHEHT